MDYLAHTMIRWLIILVLTCQAGAVISFHAVTASPPNVNTFPMTIPLPTVSNGDGVICYAVIAGWATSNAAPWTVPAGYTAVANVAAYAVYIHLWQTGDPTSIAVTNQNGATGFATGSCVSYSGGGWGSTAAMLDGNANAYTVTYADNTNLTNQSVGPTMQPSKNSDWEVCIFMDSSNTGTTMTTASGFTNRQHNAPGPNGDIEDVSGISANTADATINMPNSSVHLLHGAVCLLLAQGTSVTRVRAPYQAARYLGAGVTGDFNVKLFPQTKDLICYEFYGPGTTPVTVGAGAYVNTYTQTNDVATLCRSWTSGDPTNPTVLCNGSTCNSATANSIYIIRDPNPDNLTLQSPSVDTSGSTTTASGTSLASSNLSLAGTSDYLTVYWSAGDFNHVDTNAWTLSASLANDFALTPKTTETNAVGSKAVPSNPTGTFTSTIGVADRLSSGAVAFKIVTGAAFQPRHTGNAWVQ